MSEIEARCNDILTSVKSLCITDDASYRSAVELLRAVKQLRTRAEEHHRPVIRAAFEAHQRALDALKKIDRPLKEAEAIIKRALCDWYAEQSRVNAELAQRMKEELGTAIVPFPSGAPSPRLDGIARRTIYRVYVCSLIELIRWVAENPSFAYLLEPNMTALNSLARAQRENLSIPGIQVIVQESISVKGAVNHE